jgi:hypothetical protein
MIQLSFDRQHFRKHHLKAKIAISRSPSARQRHTKAHSHVNKDSAKVSVDMRNLGITRHLSYNEYRRPTDELFGVVVPIRSSWTYERDFIRGKIQIDQNRLRF